MFVEIDLTDVAPLNSTHNIDSNHLPEAHWIVNLSNVSHIERTRVWQKEDNYGKRVVSYEKPSQSMEITVTVLWGIQIHGTSGKVLKTYYSDDKEKIDYLVVKLLEAISLYHCTSTINFDDYESFCSTNEHINAGVGDTF
tara:strand:+ start:172 stop:591 length:420 start_codon:yes stop_codon:yes gene_type:complete